MGYPVAYRTSTARDVARTAGSQTSGGPSLDRYFSGGRQRVAQANEAAWNANRNVPVFEDPESYRPKPGPRRDPYFGRRYGGAAGFDWRGRRVLQPVVRATRQVPGLGRAWDLYNLLRSVYDAQALQATPTGNAFYSPGYRLTLMCNAGGSQMSGLSGFTGCIGPLVVQDNTLVGSTNLFFDPLYVWTKLQPYITPGNSYALQMSRWTRIAGSPNTTPYLGRIVSPLTDWPILLPPMIDPFTPPNMPSRGAPQPIPYRLLPTRQPNPFRSPTEQSSWGPEPTPAPAPPPSWGPPQVAYPGPGTPPTPAPPHKWEPPGRKVKEKKSRIRKGMAIVLKAAHTATEFLDALDAIEKALPKKYRAPKGSTPQVRAWYVYKNYRHVDVKKAVWNLVANHVVDAVIGRASGKADQFFKRYGITHGGTIF